MVTSFTLTNMLRAIFNMWRQKHIILSISSAARLAHKLMDKIILHRAEISSNIYFSFVHVNNRSSTHTNTFYIFKKFNLFSFLFSLLTNCARNWSLLIGVVLVDLSSISALLISEKEENKSLWFANGKQEWLIPKKWLVGRFSVHWNFY